ncbi:MAG: peptide chain release factor 1 [Eubacteriales bacterium]|nr:peptide chain release factor 1 [Eubacteriales bacterium]
MFEEVNALVEKHTQLMQQLTLPEVFNDFTRYSQISKEAAKLAPVVETYRQYQKLQNDITSAQAITDPELAELAKAEIAENQILLAQTENELRELLTPKDERDEANVIIEIRPAAGGDEACLFAAVLLRMYTLYANANGFNVEITDIEENGIGGVKNVTFMVKGDGAYSKFKYESGVHRVQRVPETESQGRIHTSTATVAVLPEATTVDFQIDEKDLRIDVYRASGAGGQHINKTESAIRITHIPTNMVVTCQDGRSQLANREKAMTVLVSKLAHYYQSLEDEKYASERHAQVGTGDRSERIRTYNYPQGRVTDHRINRTEYNLTKFVDGEIADMVEALRLAEIKEKA